MASLPTKKVRADRVEGARREGGITSDSESLLGSGATSHASAAAGSSIASSTSSSDELVGRICRVRGHDEAVLCTGKPVFFCFCFPWTFEYMLLRDDTSVRVIALESAPGEQTVYRVQVLRSSTHVDDGMLGTIRGCWLVPDNTAAHGGKTIESVSSAAKSQGGRRSATTVPFFAAVSRSAVAAVTSPTDDSPEADLRDRITQILTTKGSHTHGHHDDNTFVSSSSTSTSTSTSTSSVSLSMMSSTSSTPSVGHSNNGNGNGRARPGLPSDGSTRISPGKADSKRPAHADERVQIVVHPGGMLPSISSVASSYDMDHSYKTPPGSPGTSSRALVASTAASSGGSIASIPLLPPPVGDDVTVTLSSHHTTIMVGTSVSSSTSISSSTTSKVDHPLHARYTTPSAAAAAAVTGTATITTTTVATATMTNVTPTSTTSVNIMRATRDEEKYPVVQNGSVSMMDAPMTPLSPTSAILAAIGEGASPSSSLSNIGHAAHRAVLSSDITSITLSTIDITSSSLDVLSPTTAAVMSRVGANGASFANFRLPEGDIQAADIEAIVQLIAAGARDITYPLIFARLAGTKRLLSGDVLRPFLHELLNKANVQATQAAAARDAGAVGDVPREAMDVLWKLCAQIIDIRTGVDFLEINFNFGAGVKETTIKVPGTYTWVLDAKCKEAPLAVHPLNKPKYHCSDARQLVIRNQVRFKMNATGIESVRDGDLGVKQIFKFNAGLRTEHKANTIEYDSLDRPFIEVRDGKPLIVDGHYVPRRLNDWLVVNVLKKDVYIGLPDLAAIS